jgi:hypothetical protein
MGLKVLVASRLLILQLFILLLPLLCGLCTWLLNNRL